MKRRICYRTDCRTEFEVTRSHKKFCSTACKKEFERRQRVAGKVYNEIMRKGHYGHHSCPSCGQETKGSYSEGGILWAICEDCMMEKGEE